MKKLHENMKYALPNKKFKYEFYNLGWQDKCRWGQKLQGAHKYLKPRLGAICIIWWIYSFRKLFPKL